MKFVTAIKPVETVVECEVVIWVGPFQ